MSTKASHRDLPRLLYVGEVPIESSYHGSALLFRILEGYPEGRLHVVESDLARSLPPRRLPGVSYRTLRVGSRRLLNSRVHDWYSLWLSSTSKARASRIPMLLRGFIPEAVLTVAHGYTWVTAAKFAERHRLPLYMVVHDDWPRVARVPRAFSIVIERQFRRVYCAAAARLCVSPFMADEFRRRYGVGGQVMYPSRAKDATHFSMPPERLRETGRGIVVAFAGTLNTPDYFRLLRMVAQSLESHGGRLQIYGPLTVDQAATGGLDRPNIEIRGLLRANELIEQLRSNVDVLLIPMSFASGDRSNMELGFPSKLTDYTAVGVPLLILGPPYCSAVKWGRENLDCAEVIDSDDQNSLESIIQRLATDAEHRLRLAKAALAVGSRFFSHEAAQTKFYATLRGNVA